jgi:hypothetical protein
VLANGAVYCWPKVRIAESDPAPHRARLARGEPNAPPIRRKHVLLHPLKQFCPLISRVESDCQSAFCSASLSGGLTFLRWLHFLSGPIGSIGPTVRVRLLILFSGLKKVATISSGEIQARYPEFTPSSVRSHALQWLSARERRFQNIP